MSSRPVETDVLIVGGGPVGLALGLDLSYRGVRHVIVERTDGSVGNPRVGTVGPRSMELFRRWGIASRIRQAGWPGDHPLDVAWVTAVGGHEIYRARFGTTATRECPDYTPEPDQVCPQHWLVPLMMDSLGRYPDGPLRLRHHLDRLERRDDHVLATVTDTRDDSRVSVAARFVVACDGAGSSIRKAIQILAPTSHRTRVFRNILFEAPKLRDQLGEANALVYFLTSPTSLRYPLRAMDGRALYRLTVNAEDAADRHADPMGFIGAAITLDTPVTVLSDDVWYLTHRVAETYRVSRVLLAGDAAHTLSPSGGFGMNTGIADAADLGWKLAAVLDGWGGGALIDGYEAERRPVAVRSLAEANRNLERTMRRTLPPELADDTPQGERARARVGDEMRRANVAREFDAPDVHLGCRYDSALIAAPPVPAGDADWRTAAVPGARAPHCWTDSGLSTLDLFGDGFVLLHARDGDAANRFSRTFAAHGIPLRTVPADPRVTRRYVSPLVLVRPDGHVAWCGGSVPADLDELADRVRGGRPAGTGA